MSTSQVNSDSTVSKRWKLLLESTVSYLFSLAPEVADAVFRCAILRWFNPEVLGRVLAVGTISDLEMPAETSETTPQDLYQQLCELPYAEEYPGRGHSFHDLTRELVLSYLWKHEPDFYREVSDQAASYFSSALNAQLEQSERGEIEPREVDWDLGVEVAYHGMIADEQAAIETIGNFLDFLLQQPRLGTYHAVLRALVEHADAGRVSPDGKAWLDVWRLQEAVANYNIAGLESMAAEIREAPEASAPRWLKAEATYLLADGLYIASRYDEAEHYLKQSIEQWQGLEDDGGVLRAVIELGRVELARQNYQLAIDRFVDALSFYVQRLRIPLEDEQNVLRKSYRTLLRVLRPLFFGNRAKQFLSTSLGFDPDTPLLVLFPEAWHRRELYLTDGEDQYGTEPGAGDQGEVLQEEIPEVLVLYFIEIDTAELGIDISDLSEDEAMAYQWPVQFDSTVAQLWYYLGLSCQATDQYDLAAACARLAGQMYYDLDDLSGTQAAVHFLKALGANIGDLEFVESLEEFQQELLSAALARNDQRAVLQGQINRAASQLDVGKYRQARATYEEAYSLSESLGLTNEKATCIDGLARLKWIDGEYDQAVDLFRRALELYEQIHSREGAADSLISLGDLYVDRDELAEGEKCYLRALDTYEQLQVFSGRFGALLGLSEVRTAEGDYEGSLAYLGQALALSRSREDTRLYAEAVALSTIATLHLSLGHSDRARDLYGQALAISDRIAHQQLAVSILLSRAQTLSSMAEYTSAVEVYEQIIERDPTNTSAYSGKSWALQYLGKEKAAETLQTYKQLVELRPDHWWAHKGIANALRLMGDDQAAVTEYQRVVDQIQKEEARLALRPTQAWCYYQMGKYREAEELLREVVVSDPDPISDFFDLGLVLLCSGRYAEALPTYEEGIGHLQRRYPPLIRLGLIHVAIVDLEEAIEMQPSLSAVGEYDRILGLLNEQRNLARSDPEGKPPGK